MAEGDNEQVAIHGQVLTAEPAAVYGIWNLTENRWVVMVSEVFHTIYRAVAEAQLHWLNQCFDDDFCVRELPLPDKE